MMRTIPKYMTFGLNIILIFSLLGSVLPPYLVSASTTGGHAISSSTNEIDFPPMVNDTASPKFNPLQDQSFPLSLQSSMPAAPASNGNWAAQATNTMEGHGPALPQVGPVNRTQAKQEAQEATQADLIFIENVGQFDQQARFQVRRGLDILHLTPNALWLTALEPPDPQDLLLNRTGDPNAQALTPNPRRGVNLKVSFPGANPQPRMEPFNRLETKVSYFIGDDPANWQPDVPVWGGVRYVDLYPGIDLEISGENGQLVPRLVLRDSEAPPNAQPTSPEAKLNVVQLHVDGADNLSLDGNALRMNTAVGDIAFPLLQPVTAEGEPLQLPASPPKVNGRDIAAPFAPASTASVSPAPVRTSGLASPLVRPLFQGGSDLIYSTLLGGGGECWFGGFGYGCNIAVDGAGNTYVSGLTTDSGFPTTPGALDPDLGGSQDAFVVKVNPSGSGVIYATFLGGNSTEYGYALAINQAGEAYIGGTTSSSDFPATAGALDTSLDGFADAFVAKLNTDGTGLAYATYLGGASQSELVLDIAVDSVGNAYLVGRAGINFPTTAGAFDTALDGSSDAFVAKLNAGGSTLIYSTYLGGDSWEEGTGIAVNGAGNAYVTGDTSSDNFPKVSPLQATRGGSADVFVTKLNANGSALLYSTYLGGSGDDRGEGLALDSIENIYVAGYTLSSNFPTANPLQASYGGTGINLFGGDAFAAKLNPAGSALIYSTYMGGNGDDAAKSIAVDNSGNAYLTGLTQSSNFPTTAGALDTTFGGGTCVSGSNSYPCSDAFVVKLNPAGTSNYATFLGGNSRDEGLGITVDGVSDVYVAGFTFTDFPTTPGAYDTTPNGGIDAFVAKLEPGNYLTISGNVMDDADNPLSDVIISTAEGYNTSTDTNGDYFMAGLPAGTYTLVPTLSGYDFSPPDLTVSASSDTSGYDFVGALQIPTFSITGTVLDTVGNPISDTTLSLTSVSTTPTTVNTVSDATGHYTFSSVFTGTYTLTPTHISYQFAPISTTVTVPPSASGVNFTGTLVSYITGTVLDNEGTPITNTTVSLTSNLTSTTPISTLVNASGHYTFSNLITDTFTLTPTKDSYIFAPVSTTVSVPPSATGVAFTGTQVYSITGSVLDDVSNPITNTLISLTSDLTSTIPITTLVDGTGLYTVTNLISGTYTITPTKEPYVFAPISATVSVPPSVAGLNFTGTVPIVLEIFDPTGITVTQLIANTEGWPTPNPLTTTVTLSCPSSGPDCTSPLTITINSPDNARFYVFNRIETNKPAGIPFSTCPPMINGSNTSYSSYEATCTISGTSILTVPAGQQREINWSLWVQPSEALSLAVTADWGTNGIESQFVQIPKAKIHPLVFVPGFLGTWPPKHGGKPDPITRIYDNLLEALERTGYERGQVGDGSTLNPFGYDWRQRVSYTGEVILKDDIDLILTTAAPNRNAYVNYDQVDIVAHSGGGLVSRAYIEHASANNEQNVNKLITLASPHRGVPGAYRGWFGGDPTPLNLNQAQFQRLIQGLSAFCEFNLGSVISPPGTSLEIYMYLQANMPAVPQLLPATGVPDYLVENVAPFTNTYPYGHEINTFINDLNDDLTNVTGTRDFDVNKLNTIPQIISSYSSSEPTDGVYRVVTTTVPPLWGQGEPANTVLVDGDTLVPDYSGNLLQVVGPGGGPAGNIIGREENVILGKRLAHVSIVHDAEMVRRVISYTTDIDVTNIDTFWNAPYIFPTQSEIENAVKSCSPVRLLVIDAMGRRAGLDLNTGQVINEIPGAFVTELGDEPQLILLPKLEGGYRVEGVGVAEGFYRVGALGEFTTTHATSFGYAAGQADIGQHYEFSLDSPVPQEITGTVTLEAEQFVNHVGRSNRVWTIEDNVTGYSGTGYIGSVLDTDIRFTNNLTTTSPELQYTLDIATTGVYTVWLKGYAPNAAGDSVSIGFDNQPVTELSGFVPHQWSWSAKNSAAPQELVTLNITTPGLHILNLWMREDGLLIDKIVLTTDSTYNPDAP